jgi:hypothetical protein
MGFLPGCTDFMSMKIRAAALERSRARRWLDLPPGAIMILLGLGDMKGHTEKAIWVTYLLYMLIPAAG